MEDSNEIAEFLTSRRQRVRPEQVGLLEIDHEIMDTSAEDRLTLSVCSAEPGSRSQQALDVRASWTAAPERMPTAAEA